MLMLRQVSFSEICKWAEDFRHKAGCNEAPPDGANAVGIYDDDQLVGYFILVSYSDATLEINQGYLAPGFRHKGFSTQAMTLLQKDAKKFGYKQIILKASRTLKAYERFMTALQYKPIQVIYGKEI